MLPLWWWFADLSRDNLGGSATKYIFTQADLNMRQRRWLELIKDYDLEVHYLQEKLMWLQMHSAASHNAIVYL